MHEYETVPPLVHADLYRLGIPEDGPVDDSTLLALSEQRMDGRVLFVEWGAPFVDALGGDAVTITLDVAPRSARLGSTGAGSGARVAALRL
jgi:tRNA threonylcarbamoyladenosine biosynthesis protein TsaE